MLASGRLQNLLDLDRPLVLDGGMGSELQARGARVIAASPMAEQGRGWTSALANLESPELVKEIHRDYLRVGADIIISNNFSTSPTHLKWFNLEGEWRACSEAAIKLAVETRDEHKPEAAVFAGFAAPGSVARDRSRTFADLAGGVEAYQQECLAMGSLLAGAAADAIIVEIIRFVSDAVLAAEALSGVGVPVYLGLLADNEDGKLSGGENYQQLLDALSSNTMPDGIFLHCGKTSAIGAGLPEISNNFDGVIGAYGNLGYESGAFIDESRRGNWFNTHGATPYSFACEARDWIALGARVVGGCCATGPEHILMLHSVLAGPDARQT